MLTEKGKIAEKIKHILGNSNEVSSCSEHSGLRLTEDLLDVQKIESKILQLNKENLDLNALISNLVDYFRSQLEREKKKNGGELSLQYELNRSKPIFVEADRDRLVRVIHNFLDSSLKFAKEGFIVVMLSEEEGQEKADNVIITVNDTGKGIVTKLFSKFVTKSYQGTRLGLYICNGIIEARWENMGSRFLAFHANRHTN